MIDVLRQVRTNGVTVVLVEHDMPSVMEVSDRAAGARRRPPDRRRPAARGGDDPKVIAAYLGTPDAAYLGTAGLSVSRQRATDAAQL